jgi:hypothetical protein
MLKYSKYHSNIKYDKEICGWFSIVDDNMIVRKTGVPFEVLVYNENRCG